MLLAEDNPDMGATIASALDRDGYAVTSVADGAALLALIDARPSTLSIPELIGSDVRMPERTGLDVLKQLRRTD